METAEVYVENYIYRNEQNGYCVLECIEGGDELVAVGVFGGDVLGETLELSGSMTTHPSYGDQFKVTSYRIIRPTDEEGIRRYLSSGAVKGIGEKMAAKIVDRFGKDTLAIMENEPERLAEIKGISLNKAQKLGLIVEQKKYERDSLMFLQKYGISVKTGNRIIEEYGDRLIDVISTNPYRLAEDIDGIGFKTADEIASMIGVEKDSPFRIQSGVKHVLGTSLMEGDTCLDMQRLLELSCDLLSVPEESIRQELSQLVMKRDILIRNDFAFLSHVYRSEQRIARILLDHNWTDDIDENAASAMIDDAFEKRSYTPEDLQKTAILESMRRGVLILTGGPGTGKTTTLNVMISILIREKMRLALAAPTGRAAKRMSEATGYEAKTIHRLLEVKALGDRSVGRFERNEDNPLEVDAIIIDEMSMVDIFLFESLLKAIPRGASIVLVGDPDQLPSVGPGQVLSDLIESGAFPLIQLQTVFRQEQESAIVKNAHLIRKGKMIDLSNRHQDFVFLKRDDVSVISRDILTLALKQLPRHFEVDPMDVQVLTPVKKGPLGVENLNSLIQRYANPPGPGKAEVAYGDRILRVGDKVMQVKNDYEMNWTVYGKNHIAVEQGSGVFNGDVGRVISIDNAMRSITVLFDDMRQVEYSYEEGENLLAAYALTIHKSQGSEYDAVVLPLLHLPVQMSYRNLFYTAVTRAVKCVVVIGSDESIKDMIGNEDRKKRNTSLKWHIEEMGAAPA